MPPKSKRPRAMTESDDGQMSKPPYSKLKVKDANRELGVELEYLLAKCEDIDTMLSKLDMRPEITPEVIASTKKIIFPSLGRYLCFNGYPSEMNKDYEEENLIPLMWHFFEPVVDEFMGVTKTVDVRIRYQKPIELASGEEKGRADLVLLQHIYNPDKRKYVCIVEAKKSVLPEGMLQCLAAMRDAYNTNGDEGPVFGIITCGTLCRMAVYDGKFKLSNQFEVLFDEMKKTDQEKWERDYSKLVDCLFAMLSRKENVKKKRLLKGNRKRKGR